HQRQRLRAQRVAERQRALRIAVDDQRAMAERMRMGCKMRADRGLARATFARGHRDDVHGCAPRCARREPGAKRLMKGYRAPVSASQQTIKALPSRQGREGEVSGCKKRLRCNARGLTQGNSARIS